MIFNTPFRFLSQNFNEDVRLTRATSNKYVRMAGASSRVAVTDKFQINIIWHIVADPDREIENIPDERIKEQTDTLNLDFSNGNADLSDVPSAFSNVIGNPGIHFRTDRIRRYRKQKPLGGWGVDEAVKDKVAVIEPDRYLNIWVCHIGGDTMGYARFPGGRAKTDGVVMDFRYVGNTDSGSYNLGRTTTHEVGHYLGLYHTFEGGCNSKTGDFMDDTPKTKSNSGCPAFPHVSCPAKNGEEGVVAMTNNFMDYVSDKCMNMFTKNQATAMRSVLDKDVGSRRKLAQVYQGVPPSTGWTDESLQEDDFEPAETTPAVNTIDQLETETEVVKCTPGAQFFFSQFLWSVMLLTNASLQVNSELSHALGSDLVWASSSGQFSWRVGAI